MSKNIRPGNRLKKCPNIEKIAFFKMAAVSIHKILCFQGQQGQQIQ